MPYKAIIFDLYGTLVENFSRRAYDKVQAEMAKILGVPYPKFWQAMGKTITDRSLGNLSAEENIVEVCRRLGVKADRTQIEQTVFLKDEFTRNSIIPKSEVSEALNLLKINGWRIGLITNCNSAVPRFFPEFPLAQYIDAPPHRCEV